MKTLAEIFDNATPEPNTGCLLWLGGVNRDGYPTVFWEGRTRLVTRLVMGGGKPLPEGQCALHKCDVPCCVNPAHLWAGTQADNMADKVSKGRARGHSMKGEKHPSRKLSDGDVRFIFEQRGRVMQRDLAARFGVSQTCISNIHSGRRWSHITRKAI